MRLPGDHDLGFVRRQLDDLGRSRVMGAMTDSDRTRYQDLCERERLLLVSPGNGTSPELQCLRQSS
jgi:hypothetical protein